MADSLLAPTAPAPSSESPARRRRRRRVRPGVLGLWLVTALVGIFLLVPVCVVVVFSFNSERSLTSFGHVSTRWYGSLAHNSALLDSVRTSLQIAATTAVVATILGSLLAFGLSRSRSRWSAPASTMLLTTLVTPEIATAVALFLLFSTVMSLDLSIVTVTLAHITFSIVYVTVIVRTRLTGLRRSIEDAARDLGCTELQTLRLVVLPQVLPSIIGAALLVFVLSFGDFVTSMFTSGVGTAPLPVYIYGAIKFGLSPEINAIGTLMVGVSVVLGLVAILLVRGKPRT